MRGWSKALAVVVVAACLLPLALPAEGRASAAKAAFSVPPQLQDWLSAHMQGPAAHQVPTRDEARSAYMAKQGPHPASAVDLHPDGLLGHGVRAIIAGSPVPAGAAPGSLVRLAWPDEERGFCSGTAVSPFLVLTAAHCIQYISPTFPVTVLAGTRVIGGSGTAIRYAALGAIADPQWDPATNDHDAAVVVLAKPFPGPFATLAAADTHVANGTALELFGWGMTASGTTPLRLRHATVHALDNGACDARNAPLVDPNATATTEAMVCTWDGVHGGCYGDSGGPLFLGTGPGRTQVGIVSWGSDVCDPSYASVYARVAALHGFLDPLLAAAPLRVDVKAPWVDWAALLVGPTDAPLDACGITFQYAFAWCASGSPALVNGNSVTVLEPLRGPVGVALEAEGPGNPIALPVGGTATLASSAVGAVAVTPKPLAALLRVAADPIFPVTAVTWNDEECDVVHAYAVVWCDGSDVFGLRYPYLGSMAPLPNVLAWGGTFGGPWPATGVAVVPGPFKVGSVGTVAPRLALAPSATILAPKFGKGVMTDVTLWPQGASDPRATCTYVPLPTPMIFCDGDAAGLLGGRILVAALSGPYDLEALQYLQPESSATSAAIAEGIPTPPAATVAVPLSFGAPAKLA